MERQEIFTGRELRPRLGRKSVRQAAGSYALLFFLFSFYGWLLETAHFVIRWGKLTDRGFLSLPLCPIYGFSLLAAGLVLGSPRKGTLRPLFERAKRLRPAARCAAYGGLLLLYYVFASALPAGAELAVGAFCDKLLGIRLWDYSYKGNDLFGYITLDRTLVWGVLLALMLTIVWEPLRETFCSFAPAAKRRADTFAAVLCALMLIDYAFNLIWLAATGEHFLLFNTFRF